MQLEDTFGKISFLPQDILIKSNEGRKGLEAFLGTIGKDQRIIGKVDMADKVTPTRNNIGSSMASHHQLMQT